MAAFSAPIVIEHVSGYTLAGKGMRHFSAIAFDHGKVLATGDAANLRERYPSAQTIDGQGRCLTRTDHDDQPAGGWYPEQAMTLIEAFRAFTLDAAYAEHNEQRIGSLEPGKWADFILVDRDLFKIPPADIWKTTVQETWLGGRMVYRRP